VYYPRSFLKFILLSFLLVSLPLVYALVELIVSLDRLQVQGQEAVQQAAQAGRASRQLFEQASTMERVVRQFLILEDSALLDDYGRVRQEFRGTARQLALLPLSKEQLDTLESLADAETRLNQMLTASQRAVDGQAQLAEGYAKLADGAQSMLGATNDLTERAIEQMQDIASQGRQKWRYLAYATVAIALALAILFAVLIARPIRQLDQAIRRMGTADFTHRIEVNGPQDLRYLGQRLEWLRSRLHDLEEQQNRFLRHVSHELKTPLTAVREGAELPQTLGPVLLPELIRGVVKEHKLAALARMIAFDARLTPSLIVGDAGKIRTIVDNLVSNAIKYSPRSGTIALNLAPEDGYAVFDVIDQGHGIEHEERQRIFDSFYQGKPPAEGRVKGSGLGLAIAREYALAHGGRIEVVDRADGKSGAHFRLWLPLALGAAGGPERRASAEGPMTVSGGP
jgi:two-component system sensor histidine kinase GlrK